MDGVMICVTLMVVIISTNAEVGPYDHGTIRTSYMALFNIF